MRDEMIDKHYPLPAQINETSIKAAYKRAIELENYATEVMFKTQESGFKSLSDEALLMADEMM